MSLADDFAADFGEGGSQPSSASTVTHVLTTHHVSNPPIFSSSVDNPSSVGDVPLDALDERINELLEKAELLACSVSGSAAVLSCTALIYEMSELSSQLFTQLKSLFAARFPELEEIVLDPLSYALLVLSYQQLPTASLSSVDPSKVSGLDIPAAARLTIAMTAASSKGRPFTDRWKQQHATHLAECIVALVETRSDLLEAVETAMSTIAPRVTHLVGASVASRLIAAAGSLEQLACMPSSAICQLGASKEKQAFVLLANRGSNAALGRFFGFLTEAEILQRAPEEFKERVARVVATKIALCARCDAFSSGQSCTEEELRRFRSEVEDKLSKWLAPPTAKQIRPIPAPFSEKPRVRRAGRRVRKYREKYATSEAQKLANRMTFMKQDGVDYGAEEPLAVVLPPGGGTSTSKSALNKRTKQRLEADAKKMKNIIPGFHTAVPGGEAGSAMVGTATSSMSGLQTNVAPSGMITIGPAIAPPPAKMPRHDDGTRTYFGASTGFFVPKEEP
jgi:RNA processing factor Prp31